MTSQPQKGQLVALVHNRPLYWMSWLATIAALGAAWHSLGFEIAKEERWQAFQFSTAIVFVAWIMWHCGVASRVAVTASGVEVVNFIRHYVIPWTAVVGTSSQDGLSIHLRSGRRISAMVVGDSILSAIGNNRRQKALRIQVDETREAAHGHGVVDDERVRSYWDLHLFPFIGLIFFFLIWVYLV